MYFINIFTSDIPYQYIYHTLSLLVGLYCLCQFQSIFIIFDKHNRLCTVYSLHIKTSRAWCILSIYLLVIYITSVFTVHYPSLWGLYHMMYVYLMYSYYSTIFTVHYELYHVMCVYLMHFTILMVCYRLYLDQQSNREVHTFQEKDNMSWWVLTELTGIIMTGGHSISMIIPEDSHRIQG